jgi:hypothetical protein
MNSPVFKLSISAEAYWTCILVPGEPIPYSAMIFVEQIRLGVKANVNDGINGDPGIFKDIAIKLRFDS